jgi:hypothetical protein
MRKGDVLCPKCNAGFWRIELSSLRGTEGDYHCPLCDQRRRLYRDRSSADDPTHEGQRWVASVGGLLDRLALNVGTVRADKNMTGGIWGSGE